MSTCVRIAVRGDRPPLALEFHPRGSAVYLRLSDRPVARTVEVETGALADYDAHGALVGFELLGVDDPHVGELLARLKARFAAQAPELHAVEALPA